MKTIQINVPASQIQSLGNILRTIQINVPARQLQSLIHTNASNISNIHSTIFNARYNLAILYRTLEANKDEFVEELFKYCAEEIAYCKDILVKSKRDLKNAAALQKSFKQALKGT